MPTKPQLNPFLKLAFDLGPLLLFFFANSRYGIFTATATFMVAVLAALIVSYVLTRHFPIMTIVTAIIVVKTFLSYVTRHGFTLFAWWRVIVGTLGLVALAMGK